MTERRGATEPAAEAKAATARAAAGLVRRLDQTHPAAKTQHKDAEAQRIAIRADALTVRRAVREPLDRLRQLTTAMHATYDSLYTRVRRSERRLAWIGTVKTTRSWLLIAFWLGLYLTLALVVVGLLIAGLANVSWLLAAITGAGEAG